MTICYCFKVANSAFYQEKKIEVNIRPETSHDISGPKAVAHNDVRQNTKYFKCDDQQQDKIINP